MHGAWNVCFCHWTSNVWPLEPKIFEEHFTMVLFIMLYNMVLTSESVGEILKGNHSIESYWASLWYCLLCCTKMDLNFEPVDEILKCDHWNESSKKLLSCGTVYYAVQDHFKYKILTYSHKRYLTGLLRSSGFSWVFYKMKFNFYPTLVLSALLKKKKC